MKISKSKDSPWKKKLYFDSIEFEIMMDELRNRAGEKCFTEGKGIDVEYVLLRGYNIDPDYKALPENIMGKTIFSSNGKIEVLISSTLADQAQTDNLSRKRLRTTIAHEIGHIACHKTLFLKDESSLSLFDEEKPKQDNIMCRESTIDNYRYTGEWWEYQANQCMATLLLPKTMLIEYVENQMREYNLQCFEDAIVSDCADTIIKNIASQFDVSFEAMFYRLKQIGYIPNPDQFRLALKN